MMRTYKRHIQMLFAVVISLFILSGCTSSGANNNSDRNKDLSDYPPMVMFNGSIYVGTVCDTEGVLFDEVGEIQSYIDFGIPSLDNQANDPLKGCKIYTSESFPDYIFVLNDNLYSPYKIDQNQ